MHSRPGQQLWRSALDYRIMSCLSIVIPVLNEYENLTQLAPNLAEQAGFAEKIVVDGGSTDGSQKIAETFAHKVIDSPPSRAVQMNVGAKASTKKYLLFLHADTRLSEGFEPEFRRWVEAEPAWGFSPVKLDGKHWLFRVIERAINCRTRLTHIASGDQAICVLKERFFSLGGYQEIPLMEDIALSKQLSKVDRPKIFIPQVMTSSRRWEQNGIMRTVFLMWRLRLSYYLGVSPRALASAYR